MLKPGIYEKNGSPRALVSDIRAKNIKPKMYYPSMQKKLKDIGEINHIMHQNIKVDSDFKRNFVRYAED